MTQFRRKAETRQVIELIDAEGNKEFVRQRGRMGVTRHAKVLGALEKRALRYRRKGQAPIDKDEALYNEAIDETDTVPLEGLLDPIDESSRVETTMTQTIAAALENEEIKGISDDLLNVHGIAPGPKPEGVTRLLNENPDWFKHSGLLRAPNQCSS